MPHGGLLSSRPRQHFPIPQLNEIPHSSPSTSSCIDETFAPLFSLDGPKSPFLCITSTVMLMKLVSYPQRSLNAVAVLPIAIVKSETSVKALTRW